MTHLTERFILKELKRLLRREQVDVEVWKLINQLELLLTSEDGYEGKVLYEKEIKKG